MWFGLGNIWVIFDFYKIYFRGVLEIEIWLERVEERIWGEKVDIVKEIIFWSSFVVNGSINFGVWIS